MTRTSRHYRPYRCQVNLDTGRSGIRATVLLIIVFLTTAALAYVWLRSGESELNRKAQNLRSEYREQVKELENLTMELERYRGGRYILTAVERLQLNLHQPVYGQVRRLPAHEPLNPEHPDLPASGMLAKN